MAEPKQMQILSSTTRWTFICPVCSRTVYQWTEDGNLPEPHFCDHGAKEKKAEELADKIVATLEKDFLKFLQEEENHLRGT